MSIGSATAAGANSTPTPPVTGSIYEAIDPALYREAFKEFSTSEVPRSIVAGGGAVTFHLTDELDLTMVDPTAAVSAAPRRTLGESNPLYSVGTTAYGFYFGFNQRDQNILKQSFVTWAVTTAICSIPGVGQAACAIAGVAVGIAAAYVLVNGVCSNNRTLYWYDVRGGSTVNCRSTVPR